MKKMIMVVMLMFATQAFAIDQRDVASAGFNNLSAADQAKIIAQVEQMSNQSTNPMGTPEKVEAWVNIGSQIGKGLAGAARELGVAVNEFAGTPVGLLTMALIVWHFLGSVVIHVLGAILIWVVGFTATFIIMRKHTRRKDVSYDEKGKPTTTRVSISPLQSDEAVAYWFANLAVMLLGTVVLLTF